MMRTSRMANWLRSPWRWLALSAVGTAACILAYLQNPTLFIQSYWLSLLTWTGLSTGSLGILAIYGLVGGRWGELLAPPLVAAVRPLYLMALFFIPAMLLLPEIFPWARPQTVDGSGHHLAEAKLKYLSIPWFQFRAGCYITSWLVLAVALVRRRTRSGRTIEFPSARSLAASHDPHNLLPSTAMSAVGLPILILGITFSSIDWMMSLSPHWHSSAYGVLVFAGQGVAAFSLAILTASVLAPIQSSAGIPHSPWRDVGNLLFAAVCFWMYITFSQFHIIWSGNLPEEVTWYLARSQAPWKGTAIALVLLHFVVPFILLLSGVVKQHPGRLALVAALVLAMHMVNVWWLVAPELGHGTGTAILYDVLAVATIGSFWMSLFTLRPWLWLFTVVDQSHATASHESQVAEGGLT